MKGPFVLMIDDDSALRTIMGELLKQFDFNFVCAESSAEGIALATVQPPDVILCDVVLPDALGYQTAMQLHQNPLTKDVPIVFMTGYPYMRDMFNDKTAHVLLKPVSAEKLVSTLHQVLGERRRIKQAAAPQNG